ncbi:aspartyl protease family protein [Sphingomonas koreensis]
MRIGRRQAMIGATAAALLGRHAQAAAAEPVNVPITLTENRVLVSGSIGGKGPMPLVIDTGGEMGLIKNAVAEQLSLKRIGKRWLRLATGRDEFPIFEAPEVVLGQRVRLPVLALAGVDRNLGESAAASLPARVLTVVDGELDFDAGAWRVHDGGLSDRTGWTRYEKGIVQRGVSEDTRFLFAEAALNGRSFRFGLDTGMPSMMRIYRKTAEAAGLWDAPRWTPGGAGGKTRLIRPETLEIAGITIKRPLVQMRDDPDWKEFDTGLIGLPLIRLFNLATSNSDRALFLKRNAQKPQPIRYNRAGMWLERAKDAKEVSVVNVVGPGSPADKAGIRPGDRLSGIAFDILIDRTSAPSGTVLPLTVERAGATRSIELVLEDFL